MILTEQELFELTRYKRPAEQLKELRKQGFYRARIQHGVLILERVHYDHVCAGGTPPPNAPKVRLLVKHV